jgi:hypothetical protein
VPQRHYTQHAHPQYSIHCSSIGHLLEGTRKARMAKGLTARRLYKSLGVKGLIFPVVPGAVSPFIIPREELCFPQSISVYWPLCPNSPLIATSFKSETTPILFQHCKTDNNRSATNSADAFTVSVRNTCFLINPCS